MHFDVPVVRSAKGTRGYSERILIARFLLITLLRTRHTHTADGVITTATRHLRNSRGEDAQVNNDYTLNVAAS